MRRRVVVRCVAAAENGLSDFQLIDLRRPKASQVAASRRLVLQARVRGPRIHPFVSVDINDRVLISVAEQSSTTTSRRR